MKRPISTLMMAFICLTFIISIPTSTYGCDRARLTLDSVNTGAGIVDIYLTVEIGGGVTGSQKGASGDTYTYAFGFYGNPTLSNVSFTPSVTSDTTKITYNGFNAGPAFGATYAIGYLDPGQPYACISSTAACGNRHTDIKQYHFQSNEMPDSIRLFGVEGGNNPFAGCYPDADMLVDLTTLPVIWASFEARPMQNAVDLNWTTASETNNDRFLVERSGNGADFEAIGTVDAIGNSLSAQKYDFSDRNPLDGTNFYRIVQVDVDGSSSESEVAQVQFDMEAGFDWINSGVNPVVNRLSMTFRADQEKDLTLRIYDLKGQVHFQHQLRAITGQNDLDLNLSGLAAGTYYLELAGSGVKLGRKILRL